MAVAKMALSGNIGCKISILSDSSNTVSWVFGEDQARYLITTKTAGKVLEYADTASIPAYQIGTTGGTALTVGSHPPISLEKMRGIYEGWLPNYMAPSSSEQKQL